MSKHRKVLLLFLRWFCQILPLSALVVLGFGQQFHGISRVERGFLRLSVEVKAKEVVKKDLDLFCWDGLTSEHEPASFSSYLIKTDHGLNKTSKRTAGKAEEVNS